MRTEFFWHVLVARLHGECGLTTYTLCQQLMEAWQTKRALPLFRWMLDPFGWSFRQYTSTRPVLAFWTSWRYNKQLIHYWRFPFYYLYIWVLIETGTNATVQKRVQQSTPLADVARRMARGIILNFLVQDQSAAASRNPARELSAPESVLL